MTYVKFTNGSTTRLINMNNEVAQREAEDDGFYMIIGADGIPEHVESSELVNGRSNRDARLLALANKLANKNNNNINKAKNNSNMNRTK